MVNIKDFDPYDEDLQQAPFATYECLREQEPVYYNARRGFWVVSRYEDVKAAFKNHQHFSSAGGVTLVYDESGRATDSSVNAEILITSDEPNHKRLRDLVQRAFTSRQIQKLEPRMRTLVAEMLDDVLVGGHCDYAAEFAAVFPATVICELLGCDPAHRGLFKRTADDLVRNADEPLLETLKRHEEMLGVVMSHIQARKNRREEDLTSALLDAQVDGESLSDVDVMGFIFLLLIAGTETTTNLLTNAIVALEETPTLRSQLVHHPEQIALFIEEILRIESPVQGLTRTTTQEVRIGAVEIPAGEKVLLLIGAANRDERQFEMPGCIHMSREKRDHLAFGYGVHFCLGASLARLEARIGLEETLRRIPEYEVDRSRAKRLASGPIRGFSMLPIRF